jgi:hypothetical protein
VWWPRVTLECRTYPLWKIFSTHWSEIWQASFILQEKISGEKMLGPGGWSPSNFITALPRPKASLFTRPYRRNARSTGSIDRNSQKSQFSTVRLSFQALQPPSTWLMHLVKTRKQPIVESTIYRRKLHYWSWFGSRVTGQSATESYVLHRRNKNRRVKIARVNVGSERLDHNKIKNVNLFYCTHDAPTK